MAKLRSFDALTAFKKSAQLMEGVDDIPDDIQSTVSAVIDITPRKHFVVNFVKNAAYTTPTTGDTYLTFAMLSMAKVAGDTGSVFQIAITPKGQETVGLIRLACVTLTAERDSVALNFNPPILVERGSVINVNTTGTFTANFAFFGGYTVQNSQN